MTIRVLLSIGLLAAAPVVAQTAPPPPLVCATGAPARDTLGRRSLPNGFILTIRRSSTEYECEAVVTDRAGREVLKEVGFGARTDPATGWDIDGDGSGDLVLVIDTGGGNHCCWATVAFSLRPPGRELFSFDWSGATELRRDKAGRVTLWSWEGGFFGPDGTMAGRLFGYRVYRPTGGRLVDETPAHCDAILADSTPTRARLDPDLVTQFHRIGRITDSTVSIATEISLELLQLVYCRRGPEALARARTLWPAGDLARFLAEFRAMVSAGDSTMTDTFRDWPR